MNKMIRVQRGRRGLVGLVAATTIILAGCSGTEDYNNAVSSVATPDSIASESADNYDDNNYGLVTAPTLKNWIDNWSANRPAGITGKLVILQAADGPASYEFIKPNGSDVFTYSLPGEAWKETRSNGVIETISMVPSGRAVDALLAKYDIDPAKDMIVCGMGTGNNGTAMAAGRCWYMFRYWGTPKEHLAMMNGGNGWVGANTVLDGTYFSATGSTPPNTGTASVKDLPEINFALQATVEDMMNVVPAMDVNLINDGAFIWDARSSGEYSPTVLGDVKNTGSAQGHPNGALLLPYSNLLNSTAGYTYKPKAELQAYINGDADLASNAFVGSDLAPIGTGNGYQEGDTVYTYCETTYRAMVTGFATGAILGLPTRFYDGAMYEWHSLSNASVVVGGTAGDMILPWDSPWRTDENTWSMFTYASDLGATDVAARSIVNAYASSANAIINEDLAYKGIVVSDSSTTTTTTDGGSSGGALPANPCGG